MKNQYIDEIIIKLNKVRNDESIDKAGNLITEAIKNKNMIYIFGASHAGILAEELFYRAGGLALINPIFDKNLMLDVKPISKTSDLEVLENYGTIIGKNINFQKNDVLLVHSVSGRNPVMIDLVLHALKKKVKIIGITNLEYSKSSISRHKSKKRLFELCDIIIDNHGVIGDAQIKFEQLEQKVAPTSTIVGATIVNCIVLKIVENLQKENLDIPIFYSANMDNTKNHNDLIFKKYKKQINYN